ncbi:MAG: sensor histidine kinase [Alphaproteobacteria bacterium]
MTRARPTASTGKPPRGVAGGAGWHLGWALAVLAAAGGLAAAGLLPQGPEALALAAVGAAALMGAVLSRLGRGARIAGVLIWGAGATAACHLTGGVAGPLAPWCLAPAAVGLIWRDRDLGALGAATALAAAALSALTPVFQTLPQPDIALKPWLSLLALSSMVVGFAVGLMGLLGELRRDQRRDARQAMERTLLHDQPHLLARLSPEGVVRIAAGAPVAGCAPGDFEGLPLGRLFAEADLPAFDAALRDAATTGQALVQVRPAHDPDRRLEIVLRLGPDGDLIAAVRDATVQHLRERALDGARVSAEQQNAGKSRFLANMSHELRTPLNAIMGFSDIMRQRLFGPMADRYAEYAGLIHESGSHLLELINDILDMSKIEAERYELTLEHFDAREAVESVLRLMRGEADRLGVNLRAVLPPGSLYAEADRRALKQITLNLISNALKFTPRGGAVTLSLQARNGSLELVVADTGVGIAREDLERLGRPYEQAGDAQQRAAGSGLGLSLVRAFARLHGGEMSLESAVGAGTAVTVRMPVLASDPAIRQHV